MDNVDVVIIGAGVVGLSVAASVADGGRSVVLLERHGSFGQESSSRNSEVIHASIYYPPDSLKGKLCIEGNERMYALCAKHSIAHQNCGKLIVAVTEEEASRLPGLLKTARGNGAKGVRIVDPEEIARLEPKAKALAALYCPSSGVVDSHGLMKHFANKALAGGAQIVYRHAVAVLEKVRSGFVVRAKQDNGDESAIGARVVINCAGLGAGEVAAMAGLGAEALHYQIHYRKGSYFRVMRGLDKLPAMLIYPVPPLDHTVGVHTCPDLWGGMRLGPYDTWSDTLEYSVDENLRGTIFGACKQFLPSLSIEDIAPDMCGFQAKRYGPGEPTRDFVIRHEVDRCLQGLINLIGIESPGLTSSPAIGPFVARLAEEALS